MRRSRVERIAGTIALALLLPAAAASPPARGELAPIAAAPATVAVVPLRLEVFINGESTHLVEPFFLAEGDRMLAQRSDLEDVGVKVPDFQDPRGNTDLAALPGVSYRYDAAHQRIDFLLGDEQRIARVVDASGGRAHAPAAGSDWGTVMNYSVFGTSSDRLGTFPAFNGANASLEGRLFSPYGEMNQTAIIGDMITTREYTLRLDSTYAYSDPGRMLVGRAGDTISGGLVWNRPLRIGGLQLQRDFGLRPDLVTQPLPNISGSAAVPSTVDVFVNNVRTYSTEVATGPYSITNLPVVSGSGLAHVVVTDATGRQTDTALPFFTTPALLARGLTDFSLDAGFARRNYGLLSDDYDRHPIGTATLRRGLTESLTLEAHAEGGDGLANGGAGGVLRIGRWGALSLALAGSHLTGSHLAGGRAGGADGGQIYADYNLEFTGFTLDLSTQRTFARFNDLAAVTSTFAVPASLATTFAFGSYVLDPRPPRALDRITLGVPLRFDPASLSASFIALEQANGLRSRIVTASLSRPMPFGASAFATGFLDLTRRDAVGVFAGLSMPLGPSIRAAVAGSLGDGGRYGALDLTKPLEPVNGSFGWRLRDAEGSTSVRTGDLAYRSAYGTADVEVVQVGRQIGTLGQLDGSIGLMNTGGLFVGNRVTDSFAVVDTGLAGIPVYQDNRLIGTTNPFGKLVVSDLHSNQRNTIGIDPLALPANAEAVSTRTTVSAAPRSGIGLTCGIDRRVDAALVAFTDDAGRPLPVGSKGRLAGSDQSFVVGYEGKAYVKHLAAENRVSIDLGDRDCAASFPFAPDGGRRVALGPVTCR